MNSPTPPKTPAAHGSTRHEGALLSWLRLLRLPTVFTALSNILCGYFVTTRPKVTEILQQPDLAFLLLASAGLYLGGMVLNDVFDAALDATERPERPIPSGRITVRAATIAGALLMISGIISAAFAGVTSLTVALMIAVAVIAYNAGLKASAAGPLAMATCRFLNLLLGTSAGIPLSGLSTGSGIEVACGLGLYILGVTWFSRSETGSGHRLGMLTGIVLLLGGLGVDALAVYRNGATTAATNGGCMAILLLGLNLAMRATKAITHPHPVLVQKTVGLMLLSLICTALSGASARSRAAPLASISRNRARLRSRRLLNWRSTATSPAAISLFAPGWLAITRAWAATGPLWAPSSDTNTKTTNDKAAPRRLPLPETQRFMRNLPTDYAAGSLRSIAAWQPPLAPVI